jgi:hypothetical protein
MLACSQNTAWWHTRLRLNWKGSQTDACACMAQSLDPAVHVELISAACRGMMPCELTSVVGSRALPCSPPPSRLGAHATQKQGTCLHGPEPTSNPCPMCASSGYAPYAASGRARPCVSLTHR